MKTMEKIGKRWYRPNNETSMVPRVSMGFIGKKTILGSIYT